MEYTSEVRKLSDLFYKTYSGHEYTELERKESRSYASLLIDAHDGYLICIPFRTNIPHNNAYLFRESVRSLTNRSGLDYTKICIIRNLDYIADEPGIVDADEYKEMRTNMDTIVKDACKYIEDYMSHVRGSQLLSKREYRKKYWYTTLKYFHKELDI